MSDTERPMEVAPEDDRDDRGSDKEKERKSSRKDKDKGKDKDKSRKRRSRSRSGDRKKRPKKEEKTDKKGSRSRSRDRSRRSDKGKDRDRDRDRRSDRERSSRDRDRDRRSGSKRRSRSKSPELDPEAMEKKRQEQAIKEERERNRDDYTVFVSQIHPKVDEKDLFEFFSHVGRVEDIRLIRDQRTQKSKGLCYVEFWERESVHKAVTLTGQLIGGYPITIVVCQDKSKPVETANTPMRLYVGQLHLNVTDSDLRPVFEAFGPLDFVDLHKDASTGTSKGFGFVQFKNEPDAKAALEALNGLSIAGKEIKVGIVDSNTTDSADSWDDGESSMALTAQSRAELMAKLGRGAAPPVAPPPAAAQPLGLTPTQMNIQMIQPTTCIVIKNMFDPKTETEADFDLDIKEDVEEEAVKFGPIKHIFVDKNSQGHVFLRYQNKEAAEKMRQTFHGRWFASRQISAEFVIEQTYMARFPDSK